MEKTPSMLGPPESPPEASSYRSPPAFTDLPAYSEAASDMTSLPTYTFVRASMLSSKLLVRCNGVDRYCFVTDSSSDSKVWIHAGASKTNKTLGCLSFPLAHNTFRIHCAIIDDRGEESEDRDEAVAILDKKNFLTAPLIDVLAGPGYPHPKTFTLKVPKRLAFSDKDLVWKYRGGDIEGAQPARYDLYDNTSGALMASLTTTKEGKKQTKVQWMVHPESELVQAVLIMSCIGIVTRLSRKGKFYNDKGMYSRWRYLWWMSTLAAVPVA